MLTFFGLSVFAFLFFGMLWRTACRWRYLAKNYAGATGPSLEDKGLQSAVLLGLGGYNALHGIVRTSVHETGVSFRVMTPFSLFHAPLFVPFEDIRGWSTTWYLDARSIELQFRKAPDVKMVVSEELAEWIASFAGRRMVLSEISAPEGRAGTGWRAFALVNAGVSVVMLTFVLAFLIGTL